MAESVVLPSSHSVEQDDQQIRALQTAYRASQLKVSQLQAQLQQQQQQQQSSYLLSRAQVPQTQSLLVEDVPKLKKTKKKAQKLEAENQALTMRVMELQNSVAQVQMQHQQVSARLSADRVSGCDGMRVNERMRE